jgi:hypothetical protein
VAKKIGKRKKKIIFGLWKSKSIHPKSAEEVVGGGQLPAGRRLWSHDDLSQSVSHDHITILLLLLLLQYRYRCCCWLTVCLRAFRRHYFPRLSYHKLSLSLAFYHRLLYYASLPSFFFFVVFFLRLSILDFIIISSRGTDHQTAIHPPNQTTTAEYGLIFGRGIDGRSGSVCLLTIDDDSSQFLILGRLSLLRREGFASDFASSPQFGERGSDNWYYNYIFICMYIYLSNIA